MSIVFLNFELCFIYMILYVNISSFCHNWLISVLWYFITLYRLFYLIISTFYFLIMTFFRIQFFFSLYYLPKHVFFFLCGSKKSISSIVILPFCALRCFLIMILDFCHQERLNLAVTLQLRFLCKYTWWHIKKSTWMCLLIEYAPLMQLLLQDVW